MNHYACKLALGTGHRTCCMAAGDFHPVANRGTAAKTKLHGAKKHIPG